MEDQVIFQNRRISDEKKISVINYCHNFIQRNIPFEIVFKKIFINQTTFDVTFICVEIICQIKRLNIFTKLIMIFNIIDNRVQHILLKEDIFCHIVSHICRPMVFGQLSLRQPVSFYQ